MYMDDIVVIKITPIKFDKVGEVLIWLDLPVYLTIYPSLLFHIYLPNFSVVHWRCMQIFPEALYYVYWQTNAIILHLRNVYEELSSQTKYLNCKMLNQSILTGSLESCILADRKNHFN